MERGVQQEPLRTLGGLYRDLVAWPSSDDWSGITNTAERKKRQNRINQRTYRRKRIHAQTKVLQELPIFDHEASLPVYLAHQDEAGDCGALNSQGSALVYGDSQATLHNGPALLTCPRRSARMRELLKRAIEEYSLRRPRPTNLPILIRLNVLNALAKNATLMGFPPEGLCSEDMVSPYIEEGPSVCGLPKPLSSCPATLTPTYLQRSVRHHPWIDLFPFPQLRDNILLALDANLFNEDDLCLDLLNVEAEDLGTRPALMTWGESWNMFGWEANFAFLQKWGWLLHDCPEIIVGSNYWREKRGERPLVFQTR